MTRTSGISSPAPHREGGVSGETSWGAGSLPPIRRSRLEGSWWMDPIHSRKVRLGLGSFGHDPWRIIGGA